MEHTQASQHCQVAARLFCKLPLGTSRQSAASNCFADSSAFQIHNQLS